MDVHSFERRLGRFQAFGILLVLVVASVSAFQIRTNQISPLPPPPSSHRIEGASGGRGFDARDALDVLPKFTGDDIVDLDKARDFARHYGKYTYEEVEHMRNGESKRSFATAGACLEPLRVSSSVFRLPFRSLARFFFRLFPRRRRCFAKDLHADRVKNDSPDDVLFLERYLEDELTSQLQSLKDDMPNPYLFRYSDEDVPKGLFVSEEGSSESTGTASTTDTQNIVALEFPVLLLEEGVLETLAIFMVAGIVMMLPQ